MFRVLLVDDEELVLVAMQYAFNWKKYGFGDVIATSDPREACAILAQQHIDAALVDIRMPGMSGLELIEAAQKTSPQTAFVVVSGYADFSYAKKAISLNVLDYFLKPIDAEQTAPLLEKLYECVLSRHLAADPGYGAKLLSDKTASAGLLTALDPGEGLTLMDLQAPQVSQLLLDTGAAGMGRVLFLSENEALLFWADPECAAAFIGQFRDRFLDAARLVSITSVPDSGELQKALQRLRMQSLNSKDKNGYFPCSTVNPETAEYLDMVFSYVAENYDKRLTLQDVAQKFGINYTYLSQLFKKHTGSSYSEHLTRIRLEHACQLLRETETKIVLIAEKVGFSDYHYFCNVFRQHFAMSPAQYRSTSRK